MKSQALPYARGQERKTCNVQQARALLCPESLPSRQHVYNLYHRGDVEGYFLGSGRGLRLYVDSVEKFLEREGEV